MNLQTIPSTCPTGLTFFPEINACARPSDTPGCVSAMFLVNGMEYTQVSGRVRGYQFGIAVGFSRYNMSSSEYGIDGAYVDGISITHGQSPRQHIWTFAAAQSLNGSFETTCPCIRPGEEFPDGIIPDFVAQDYFCDTGVPLGSSPAFNVYYGDNPLWDGEGCEGGSQCCEFNCPPWFNKVLPQSTTDDIEVRICTEDPNLIVGFPFDLLEIFIQQ